MFSSLFKAIGSFAIGWLALFPTHQTSLINKVNQIDTQVQQMQAQITALSNQTFTPQTEVQSTDPLFGSSLEIPTPVAWIDTQLASTFYVGATSFNLVNGTNGTGVNLASSTYGFVIDEGLPTEEMITADCIGAVCTNASRGLSPVDGQTQIAALQFQHNRGADIKITDAPWILIIHGILTGVNPLPNMLYYSNSVTNTQLAASSTALASVGFVASTSYAGTVPATIGQPGIVMITRPSNVGNGVGTASYNAVTYSLSLTNDEAATTSGASKLVTTGTDGKLDPSFLSGTAENYTLYGATTFSSSTASTTVYGIFQTNGPALFNSTTTLPALSATSTIATSTIAGNLTVGNNASTTNLVVSTKCTGCTVPTIVTASAGNYNGGTPSTNVTQVVSCTAGKDVAGGGFNITNGNGFVTSSYPSSSTQWTAIWNGSNGATNAAGTLYAICINP